MVVSFVAFSATLETVTVVNKVSGHPKPVYGVRITPYFVVVDGVGIVMDCPVPFEVVRVESYH